VAKWKDGRVEEWKSGRVEEWKSGRVEEWKSGRYPDIVFSEPEESVNRVLDQSTQITRIE